MTKRGRKRVLIIGAGNIGLTAIEYIARLENVGCVVVVDFDEFDDSNLRGASIRPRDVGRLKARVMMGRLEPLMALWPDFEVRGYVCRVEEIPWGEFHLADVVVSAVDSRDVRVFIADAAYQLQRPLVDAGISSDAGLVRVSVTMPTDDVPCPYCDLTPEERDRIGAVQACLADRVVAPTAAPAHLGGFAAALQAVRVDALTTESLDLRYDPDDRDKVASAVDDVVDILHGRFERSIRTRNPACPAPHRRLDPIGLWRDDPTRLTVGDVLSDKEAWLEMPGHAFATRVVCPEGHRTRRVRPLARPRRSDRCGTCDGPAAVDPTSIVERIDRTFLPRGRRHLSLGTLGLRPLDIVRHGRGADSALKMFLDDRGTEVA